MYTDNSTITKDIDLPAGWRIYDFTDMDGIVYFCGKRVDTVVGNDTSYTSLMGYFRLADYPNCDLHVFANDNFSVFQNLAPYRNNGKHHIIMTAKTSDGKGTLVDAYADKQANQRWYFDALNTRNDSLSGVSFLSLAITHDYILASSTNGWPNNPQAAPLVTSHLWYFERGSQSVFSNISRIKYSGVFNLLVKSFGQTGTANEFLTIAHESKNSVISVDYFKLFSLIKHLSLSTSLGFLLRNYPSTREAMWNYKRNELDILYWTYPLRSTEPTYSSHILHMPKTLIENNSSTVTANEHIFSDYAIWSLTHERNNASIWGVGCENNPYNYNTPLAFKYTPTHWGNCTQKSSQKLNKDYPNRKRTIQQIGTTQTICNETILTPHSYNSDIHTICD